MKLATCSVLEDRQRWTACYPDESRHKTKLVSVISWHSSDRSMEVPGHREPGKLYHYIDTFQSTPNRTDPEINRKTPICPTARKNGGWGVTDGPKRRSATLASVHYAVTQFRSFDWGRFSFSSNLRPISGVRIAV